MDLREIPMTLVTACWIAVILYCVVMFALGYITRVRSAKEESSPNFEFWIAKRQLPGWRLGVSLASGWLMLGWIGFGISMVYTYGASGAWILPIPWFILCIIILFMVPWVRRVSAVSLPQAIEKRFGISARTVVAVFSVCVFLAWTQAELFVGGTLMSSFLGVSPQVAMVVIAVPIMVYMYMGGFRASILTDIAQFVLMAIFMFVLLGVAWSVASHATGGNILGALQHTTTMSGGEGNTLSLGAKSWLFPLALLIGYLPGWMTEQDLLIRIQGAPTTKEAMKGAWTGFALIAVFVIGIPLVVAFCAIVAFPAVNGAAPQAIGAGGIEIVSAFVKALPAWVQVLMLVGILGCQMSTVDTFTNVAALPIAHDMIDPVLRKHKVTERVRLRVARWISVFVIALSLGIALKSESLGDVYNLSSGVLSASIAVPAFFIFWKRANSAGIISGSIAGFVATLCMYWYEYKKLADGSQLIDPISNAWGFLYVGVGAIAAVAVLIPVSLLTRASSAKQLAAVEVKPVDDPKLFLEGSYGG
jgi:SSS family solute:Na+ symporter